MNIQLTTKQYSALLNIYGPPESVHEMIMSSELRNGKNILTGDDEDFDELLSLISEEIGEGLCPATNIQHLLSVCKKVDPSSLDWIGM